MPTQTVTNLQNFTGYAESFLYNLSQGQAARRDLMPSYFENKSILRTLVDFANESVDTGDDIYSAQQMLNAAGDLINSPNSGFFF